MSSLLTQLKAKQKREAEDAERRRAVRSTAQRLRRKIARDAAQAGGLDDLPLDVALAIESNPAPAKPEPAPAATTADDSVPSLIERLTAIRERIWRLQAMFAVSLSTDCALEANRYLQLFQALASQLNAKDPSKLEDLVRGHESLLLAPALPIRQSIPLSTQKLVEIRWEALTQPMRRPPKRPTVPDGLDQFVT
jgi:hypothetical protein